MSDRISCEQHDYFEIVCMRQSFIELTLAGGELEAGQALDLVFDSKQQSEMIKLKTDLGIKQIELSKVIKLTAINNHEAHNFSIQFIPSP